MDGHKCIAHTVGLGGLRDLYTYTNINILINVREYTLLLYNIKGTKIRKENEKMANSERRKSVMTYVRAQDRDVYSEHGRLKYTLYRVVGIRCVIKAAEKREVVVTGHFDSRRKIWCV